MSELLRDIRATVKIAQIVGWREMNRLRKYLRNNPEEEAKEIGVFLVDNLRKEYNEACRALGLPDDWVYNEAQLRRACCSDPVLRYFAIDHLVRLGTDQWMMGEIAREKREAQLSLPAPVKALPGARL
jgi:hypothetical protein